MCILCEVMCGVKIEYQGDKIFLVVGDVDDQYSQGYICLKGYFLQDLYNDFDCLKKFLYKVNGEWQLIEWDDVFDLVVEWFVDIQVCYGNDVIVGYWGNLILYNLGLLLVIGKFCKVLGFRNLYIVVLLDQMLYQVMFYLMFGYGQIFIIFDIDRIDYMLMLGVNLAVFNGSLMFFGDVLCRLQVIKECGGKLVLLDLWKIEFVIYVFEYYYICLIIDVFFFIGLIQYIVCE